MVHPKKLWETSENLLVDCLPLKYKKGVGLAARRLETSTRLKAEVKKMATIP
jgi:hypothetical protein